MATQACLGLSSQRKPAGYVASVRSFVIIRFLGPMYVCDAISQHAGILYARGQYHLEMGGERSRSLLLANLLGQYLCPLNCLTSCLNSGPFPANFSLPLPGLSLHLCCALRFDLSNQSDHFD